ncbi:type IV secretory pathway TrbL component [Paenibacillus shirakamiensis]|uniref:Type IV secretory pathway TrbL component n=1 Tax=Paenibacillus shirakamiensis TaxID=1265935 RepID=A0ABS4JCT9_9BACL|nr:hypothetical protein [Paenibacillus shirakamiensis]MBP1999513.1 type IV secretory pathway TrbL component [Paenibacillus shirakamiensis]
MSSSSFIGGVLLGAAAVMYASKKKSSMLSGAGGGIGSAANWMGLAKQKTEGSFNGTDSYSSGSQTSQVSPSPSSQNSSAHTKESNLKSIKDIIRGNPELHKEVEQILKDTNTVIPGL